MPTTDKLPRSFYRQDATHLAKALLGQRLVHIVDGQRLAGTIVETEAYLGIDDAACHTHNGRRTQRNETMWQDGGHLYVYFTYGMHYCANVVASVAGDPVAVLLRALEPTEGLQQMYQHRPKARRDIDLCSGPAKLCAAMQLHRSHDRTDICNNPNLFIERCRHRRLPDRLIRTTPRVGIQSAPQPWRDAPLRFAVANNPHVSKP